jgi:hypothetical protein
MAIFIREFLSHWGPIFQRFEDTLQDLEEALLEEGFLLNPIESDEDITKEQAAEDDCDDDHAGLDEESFLALKESIEEDNKFFEWLVEHCHIRFPGWDLHTKKAGI